MSNPQQDEAASSQQDEAVSRQQVHAASRQLKIKNWLFARRPKTCSMPPLQHLVEESSKDFLPDAQQPHEPAHVHNSDNAPLPPAIRPFFGDDLERVARSRATLPHWHLAGSTYFITFCLEERRCRYFERLDITQGVIEAILFGNGKQYALDAFVVMPDHVHLLIYLYEGVSVRSGLANLKRFTSRQANKILGRTGKFWQHEHFDHLVRKSSYWVKFFDYIHNNPVKGKLVDSAENYPHSSLQVLYS